MVEGGAEGRLLIFIDDMTYLTDSSNLALLQPDSLVAPPCTDFG
jgi:hypothetical protein